MSDVSLVTSLIPTVNEGFTSTVGGSGVTSGGGSVPLTNVSGLTNNSVFVGIIEPGLTNQQTFTGIVDTGGSQITGVHWTRGTNAAHAAGVTVVDFVTGTAINMIGKAFLTEHSQDGTHSSAFLNKVYPVGSVYINATNSTNPASLLGFGTWVAFGPGQTIIGVGTSDQAFAAGATGGESNHALTATELATHNHSASSDVQGNHNHYSVDPGQGQAAIAAGSTNHLTTSGGAQQISWGNTTTSYAGSHSHNITVNNAGSGTAHNNLPPYIVAYLWRRTA